MPLAIGERCRWDHEVVVCPACNRPGCWHRPTKARAFVSHTQPELGPTGYVPPGCVQRQCPLPIGWRSPLANAGGLPAAKPVKKVTPTPPPAPTAGQWAARPPRALEL